MHVRAGQVVLLVLCAVVFGIPQPAWSAPRSWATPTSNQAPAVMVSEAVASKSLRIPWPGQIPKSAHVMVHRATSSTSRTSAATTAGPDDSSLGQIVVTSTKMTTLPPAVCGFVPFWNNTSSAIEIVGCNGTDNTITGVSTLIHNSNQTCVSSSGQFFCRTPTGSIETGCVDVPTWTTVTSISTVYYHTMPDWESVVTSAATGIATSYDVSSVPVSQDPLQLTCYPESYYSSAVCQTFVSKGNVAGVQCLTSTSDSFGSTALGGKTVTILGLDELRSAYPSMTLTFTASQSGDSTLLAFSTMYPTRTLSDASASNSTPSVYLDLIKSKPPSCVNALNTTCTTLFDASRRCWSEAFPPGPQGCYCEALVSTNCTQLCASSPKDRNGYYEWVMGLCSSNNATGNFSANWPEMVNRTAMVYEDLLPWPWRLQPNSTTNSTANTYVCPTMSSKLASFAAINGIIAFAVPFLGRRSLIKSLTRNFLGQPGSPRWPYTALLAAGLNIAATAINAAAARRTPNFAATVSVRELFLLWSTRPRLDWVATTFARLPTDKTAYLAVAASALLAEFVLQAVAAADLVWTVRFAAPRDFYIAGSLRFAPEHVWALLMYAGALVWLLSAAFFFVYVLYTYVILKPHAFDIFLRTLWRCAVKPYIVDPIAEYSEERKKQRAVPPLVVAPGMPSSYMQQANAEEAIEPSDEDTLDDPPRHFGTYRVSVDVPLAQEMPLNEALDSMGIGADILEKISMAWVVLVMPFIGQWLFWIGFVGLFRDRYCPPNIVSMTVVWIIFSALGIFLGAAV